MEATMHEAKSQLSKLVSRALAGEDVILTKGRKHEPIARLVPLGRTIAGGVIQSLPHFKDGKRPIGLYDGQIQVGPEFFDPLPEDELALWNGESDPSESHSG